MLVIIYVRKPKRDDGREGRRITFNIPEQIDVMKYIELGFAVDGKQFLMDFLNDESKPFPLQLLDVERALVASLLADGYDVEFR